MLTKETVEFLMSLLSAQQISVGAPDFEHAVAQVIRARQELAAAAAESEPPPAA